MVATMQEFPNHKVTMGADQDDIVMIGLLEEVLEIFLHFRRNLEDNLGVKINMQKSSLLVLDARARQYPLDSLHDCLGLPDDLRQLKIIQDGAVFAGVPIGHESYVDAELTKIVQNFADKAKKVTKVQNGVLFLQMVRHC